ncbi:MAG TPA: aminoglycoside phosphotransferase family protein [Microvirga sp.]|nr:aminoglycoside phosphotransferase family protein [Microvirga sp.]
MSSDVVTRVVQTCFPDRTAPPVRPAGEGDYCRAVLVAGEWIFLFAKHAHASACLERLARVTCYLAVNAPIAIPVVEYHGQADGRSYVGYRAIQGQPLGTMPSSGRSPPVRQALVSDLAAFFRHLHGFDVDRARSLGVPQSDYPLSMRDDHVLLGPAQDLYWRDLEAFRSSPAGSPELLAFLEGALDRHLARADDDSPAPALLHNEVSGDHVLVDSAGRVSGIIDFNGMLIGPPARDFLYLYEEHGRAFALELIEDYGLIDPVRALRELEFLHVWHTLGRLLWMVEHAHGPGIDRRRRELEELRQHAFDR